MSNNVLSQFRRFLLGGCLSVSLDWGCYFILFEVLDFDSTISKGLSYMLGTLFAFYFNGLFAFQSELVPWKLFKHLILYGGSLILNTFVFSILENVGRINSKTFPYLPLLWATLFSMTLNFLGMRFWVFKNHEGENAHR